MCNTTKETREFFMFSYFGIFPEEIFKAKKELAKMHSSYQKYVAYKCAYRAYRDVCRTIKYSVTTTRMEKDTETDYSGYKALKDAFIKYEIKLIFDGLDDLLKNNDDFDSWHKTTCDNMTLKNECKEKTSKLLDEQDKKIKDAFEEHKLFESNNGFTYGMAQKWLNMTIKNLLLAEDMFNGCTGYGDILKENRAKFHVPVDKNILNAAKDLGIKKIQGKNYSNEGWSSWDDTTYENFIIALRIKLTELNPKMTMLDWEHSAWMENAE